MLMHATIFHCTPDPVQFRSSTQGVALMTTTQNQTKKKIDEVDVACKFRVEIILPPDKKFTFKDKKTAL